MRCPKWITAQDLDRWAATPQAKVMLPDLIRRLVFATVLRKHLQKIDFPAGAETQRPGYDGTTLTTEGTAFVPKGITFWELGCAVADPRGKAQTDYEKRVDEHQERIARGETENLKEAAFVAVTAADWQKAKDWAEERSKELHFREVRAYDSNSLEQWIQDAPGVGLWLAQEIHGKRDGVVDLASYWDSIQATLVKPLPPKVLLVNREKIGEAFTNWLEDGGGILAVKAPSAAEVVAVFCAWVKTLSQEHQDEISSRAIIVESRESWRSLTSSKQPLILIASPQLQAESELFGEARRNGHHVLKFAEFHVPPNQTTELPMMRRFDLQQALEESGVGEQEARRLAATAGGNFTILRRRFGTCADPAKWAKDPNLAPLLLAGSWEDEQKEDQRVLSQLARKPYPEVQAFLARWRSEPDPPVRLSLGVWEFLSPVDAWEAIHPYFVTTQLDQFERLAVEVLSEDDPAFSLPQQDRYLAAIKGKVWRFSRSLRRGIAEILALGATREEESGVAIELQFAARASAVVAKVLPPGVSWQRWASLGELLPLLMEAAPDVLLSAIERDISSAKPQLVELIKQETPGGVFGSIHHSGVLWSLEKAAWPAERLQRVSLCLARLAKLDPGGTWCNRPSASLANIFFSWRPQTVAGVEQRIEALRLLQKREPEATWKLTIELLPEGHEVMTDSAKPVHRSWAAGWTGQVTVGDFKRFISQVTSVAVDLAEAKPEVWPELLEHVTYLPPWDFQKAVEGLERLAGQPMPEALRASVWNTLREIVQHHSHFRDARWAMASEQLAKLASVRDLISPKDLIVLNAPLFNDSGLQEGGRSETFEEKQQRRERERCAAIRRLWTAGGVEIILDLALSVKQPGAVGWSLGGEMGGDALAKVIPAHLSSPKEVLRNFASGFAFRMIHIKGREWAEAQPLPSWTPEQVGAWALQMPFDPRTWDWVVTRGELAKAQYWKHVGSWGHPGLALPERSRAVRELVSAGRAWSALQLLMQAKYENCVISHTLVCETLDALAENPTERTPGTMDEHFIHEAFDFLQSCPDADETRLAKLEFEFLPFLDRHSQLPLTLQRYLAKQPEFFVECLKLLYRERHEAEKASKVEHAEAADQAKVQRGKRIWRLLHDWRVIPGTQEDGHVSLEELRSWAKVARQKAREIDRIEVCDITLGELFAHSGKDTDEAIPLIAVREIIEECESEELERGFMTGIHNLRGVHSKALYEGGAQERGLAADYERYANICSRWPRTATLLRALSKDYAHQAALEDERAKTRD